MNKRQLIIGIFASLTLFSCGYQKLPSEMSSVENGADQFSSINNGFAFRFWNKLTNKEDYLGKNNFVSPSSISAAFAMAYLGANGSTAETMAAALGIGSEFTRQNVCDAYKDFRDKTSANHDKDQYQFSSVNKFWSQEGFGWLDSYKKTLTDCFFSSIAEYNFRVESERNQAIDDINQWAVDNTNGKINHVVGQDDINENTRFAITNAVYFLGEWASPFPKDELDGLPKLDWHASNGQTLKTEMMEQKSYFPYGENDKLQVLEMPYKGKNKKSFSMVILLPKDGDVNAMWQGLDQASYKTLIGSMSYKSVNVLMPTFKVESSFKLGDFFKDEFGMDLAFSDDADFSNMNGRKDIRLDEVIHKTFIKADNNGTEAAAVTVIIGAEITSVNPDMPIFFNANRPFGYLIKDNQTDSIVFMGNIFDPSGE